VLQQVKKNTPNYQMWDTYKATLKQHLRSAAWVSWYEEHAHQFSEALTLQVAEARSELAAERD
jgi:hypothetical protein